MTNDTQGRRSPQQPSVISLDCGTVEGGDGISLTSAPIFREEPMSEIATGKVSRRDDLRQRGVRLRREKRTNKQIAVWFSRLKIKKGARA